VNQRTAQPSDRPRLTARQDGVGFVEILVAVLLLSVGALGIALMQSHSLANNSSSMGRSMAVVMSYSILEAMRADRDAVVAGSYNTTVAGNNCPAATPNLYNKQLNAWCTQLAQVLGAVATTTGNISCTGTTPACTITVTFDDSRIGNNVAAGTNAAANQSGGKSAQTVVTTSKL